MITLEKFADLLAPRSLTGTIVRVCVIVSVLNIANLALEYYLTGVFWDTLAHNLLTLTLVVLPMVILGANVTGSQFELQKKLEHLSHNDPLTGIANRRAFFDELEAKLGAGKRGHFILLDADNFKRVNDEFGHQVGDKCIIAIAHNLRDSIRKHDLFGRIGGEEFCVFLEGSTYDEAKDLVRRLVGPIQISDVVPPLHISASIGVAPFEDVPDVPETFRRADAALYLAKSNGRARFEFWKSDCHNSDKRNPSTA